MSSTKLEVDKSQLCRWKAQGTAIGFLSSLRGDFAISAEASNGHRQQHKKIGKDHVCGSGDILTDRQTDPQSYSLQYFAATPAGKVIIVVIMIIVMITAALTRNCKNALFIRIS